jgi:hypothetical protein
MPFSTSFCLTNTGNLPSNTTLSFYSNVDGYTNPLIGQSSVPLFSVTGVNCPYTLTNVPDGTTTIKVQSSTGNCCAVINVSPNNPCSFCNIGFDYFLPNTISQIVAGNLTGSCDSVISDYRIDWYETSTGTPIFKFTTGPAGTLYGSIQHTHPLVGITSVPVPNGIYSPVLTRVNINGINYSSTSGPGFVQADLNNCFSNVTVNSAPLTCANGPELGDYSHIVNFSGASEGISPPPLTMVYQLGPNTNYLAWKFNAFDVPDNIKISYIGSYYNNQPIVLEFSDVGFNIPNSNYSLTINPKLVRTFGFQYKKVTNLSNIIRSSGDYLLIQITPNPTNLRTNFESAFQCLDTFDCSSCWDTYNTQPQQIISGSVSASTDTCNIVSVRFKASGCSISSVQDTDFYKYMGGSMPQSPGYTFNNNIYVTQQDYSISLWYSSTNCSLGGQVQNSYCPAITGNGTVIFTKNQTGAGGTGNILIKCSLIEDFNAYYQSYLTRMSELSSYSSNPTNINYYKYFILKQPILSTDSNIALNAPCGDGQPFREYNIHPSSVVTTGFTSGYYTMNLTMPTITKQIFYTNCQLGCDDSVQSVVNGVNSSSLSFQMNTTNNKSNRYTVPFYGNAGVGLYQDSRTSWTFTNGWYIPKFFAETIPYSGSPLVIIPSLSASTCTRLPIIQFCPGLNPQTNQGAYIGYTMYYKVRLTNPNNSLDFEIVTTPIVNGGWPGIAWSNGCYDVYDPSNLIVIYKVVNGQVTISNPNYFVNPPSAYTIYKRYDNI